MSKWLIFGCTGQDGSYLSELLLSKGHEVHGIIRRSSFPNTQRIDKIFDPEDKNALHYGELPGDFVEKLYDIKPDFVINLAAMSHVRISFDLPFETLETNYKGVVSLLESIRLGIKIGTLKKDIRFYQASSSEMFGISPAPRNESTPMLPVSHYGIAKLASYHQTRLYRFGYDMFCSNGILFNHESPRRGVNFVTRKVTRAIAKIALGKQDKLYLGNLEAKRDWGHSRDFMEAIYAIVNHTIADDFVVSTGEHHSVREFIEEAFAVVNKDPYDYVVIEDFYRRPCEVPDLLGDATKIRMTLGWEPKVKFKELVREMVLADISEESKI